MDMAGSAQVNSRLKAKFSNGAFMLSLKKYLIINLCNNFFKIHSFYSLIWFFFFGWENAKVITNFTINWCCNKCDQWYEAYKNTRNIIKLTTKNYKDISPITNIYSKMHSIVCWNLPIIFIVTSNYKSYRDYHAPLV